jgi:hypothetical protein
VQLGVGPGVGVLHRDVGAELDVLAHRLAEGRVGRHVGGVERGRVERHEPLPLLLGDPQPPVHGDEVGEAELAAEAVGTAERLGGELGQVLDVARAPGAEQRLEQRVGQDAVVEDLFETVETRLAACVLEQRDHDGTPRGATDPIDETVRFGSRA